MKSSSPVGLLAVKLQSGGTAMSTVKGPLTRVILKVAHITPKLKILIPKSQTLNPKGGKL